MKDFLFKNFQVYEMQKEKFKFNLSKDLQDLISHNKMQKYFKYIFFCIFHNNGF